ncbi:hypothetical protein [Empedobacter brevis]|uniref:hypothetical protein n=1 Tax=Empedobacter brevis TaxID=247 RepID=UPI002FE15380
MKMFITYLLSALFLLFFAETKVFAGTQHSQGNLSSQIVVNDNTHVYQASKVIETKFSQTSNSIQFQEFNPGIETIDDDFQTSNKIDLETCIKLLSVVLVLNFIIQGLRKKRIFYNKTIKFSSCKYILLRTIRI